MNGSTPVIIFLGLTGIFILSFGSFSLHYREPRQGRNPRTGDTVALRGKHVPHFKPGKELRDRVNRAVKSGF